MKKLIQHYLYKWLISSAETDEVLKGKLLNWLTKDLFNAVRAEDVLKKDDKTVYFLDRPLDGDRVQQIKSEAETFKKSLLWKILEVGIKNEANKSIYRVSEKIEDARFGKAMLYNLKIEDDILNEIIEKL